MLCSALSPPGALLPWPGAGETLACELAGFLLVFTLAAFTPLGMWVVPAKRKRRRAARLAKLIFLQRGLASTAERCGVLFFVSRAERYVEIIPDIGIDQAVEPGAWQQIVDAFTASVKKGEWSRVMSARSRHWAPCWRGITRPRGEKPNRIPDRLVEI